MPGRVPHSASAGACVIGVLLAPGAVTRAQDWDRRGRPRHLKLFRKLLTLREHEVVGLSGGEGLLDTHRRAVEAGFDGYITQPIDIRRFPDQVQQTVARTLAP